MQENQLSHSTRHCAVQPCQMIVSADLPLHPQRLIGQCLCVLSCLLLLPVLSKLCSVRAAASVAACLVAAGRCATDKPSKISTLFTAVHNACCWARLVQARQCLRACSLCRLLSPRTVCCHSTAVWSLQVAGGPPPFEVLILLLVCKL